MHPSADKAHHTKLRQNVHNNFECLVLEEKNVRNFKGFATSDTDEIKVFTKPAIHASAEMMLTPDDNSKIIEIFAKSLNALESYIHSICKSVELVALSSVKLGQTTENLDVKKIVDSGNPANRIDVVFMGDGYTADEREQFFSDIQRLTDDMFNGETFRSYLPLFNIHAVYVESVESGIGYYGAPKDTAFKLYRTAGQLRGIRTANAEFARQVSKHFICVQQDQ